MQLGKVRSPPIFGIIGLAAAILILSYSGAVQESFADTGVGFIQRDTQLDADLIRLADVKDMLHFKSGNTNYLVSAGGEGAHLLVVNNPNNITFTNSQSSQAWGQILDLATYESSSSTYIVGWYDSSGQTVRTGVNGAIQIFNIAANNQLAFAGSGLIDNKLASPGGLEIYSPTTGKHYAVTAGGVREDNSYVNIIDISQPSSKPSFVTSLKDSSSLSLRGPSDMGIYFTNNKHYAAVTSYYENAVSIIDISTPTNISVVGSISDDASTLLNSPQTLEIYSTGGNHYAVVTLSGSTEDGIQIIDITDPANPTAAGKLSVNNNRYLQSQDLALHSYNDRWYALIIGKDGHNSIQIVDITDPSMPVASSYIRPAVPFGKAESVETYAIDKRQFASVGSERVLPKVASGVGLLELVFLTADAGPDLTRTYGQTVTLDGAADVTAPNKTFTYAWTQTGGPNVNLSSSTALNPTFVTPSQDATLEFTLTATLAASQNVITSANTAGIITAADTVTITVFNQPPTANAGLDKSATPGSTVTLSGSGTDPDGNDNSLTYAWSKTSGTPSVTIDNPGSAQTTFTAPSQDVTLEFTLTVSDATKSTTDTVTITVFNQPPTANAGLDKSATPGSTVTLSGSGTDPDGNDNSLTYAWSKTSGTPSVTIDNPGSAQTTFTAPSQDVTLEFTLTVSDATKSTTDTVTITVFNQPPTANAGLDKSATPGSTVTLSGSGTDPDGNDNSLTYAWSKTSGTPSVTIDNPGSAQTTFTAPSQDVTLEFTLTVSDATKSTTDTVTITVLNQPPTANAGRDKSATPGSTVTLSGSGTDPDGNDADLDYEWEQTSITSETPTVAIDNSGSAQTTFTAPADPTELEFTLTVSDATKSTTDDITITIKEQTQTRNIKELKDTLVQGQITEPTQSTDPDQVGGTDLITGSNEITMIYTEPIATFINSYLNFTISGEDKPRNITGINGSPAIETGETIRINGKQVKTYSTILTFDGPPVPPGSAGSMYVQHADYYLAKIQIRDGQN